MKGIVIRWLILAASITLTSYLIKGIEVSSFISAFLAAAVLGVFNAFFRPILIVLTLPINILTLGLFTFIINAMLLKMTSSLIPGFESAVFGSLIISLISWALTSFINKHGRVSYIELKKTNHNRWE